MNFIYFLGVSPRRIRIQTEKTWDQDSDPQNNRCGSETLDKSLQLVAIVLPCRRSGRCRRDPCSGGSQCGKRGWCEHYQMLPTVTRWLKRGWYEQ